MRTAGDTRELIDTQKFLGQVLASQQSRRHEYPGITWVDVEIDVMHHHVNCDRSKRGLPDISRDVMVRIERIATGSDYASKFALHCAELAMGLSPHHKETKSVRDPARIDRMIELLRAAWHKMPDQRLGQLVTNLLDSHEGSCHAWEVEDDVAERKITASLSGGFKEAWRTK